MKGEMKMTEELKEIKDVEDIEVIEGEISDLLNKTKSDWIDFYLITQNVKENKLFKPNFNSYTSWINHVADTNKVHVSILWQRIKAGGVFERYLKVKEANKQNQKNQENQDNEINSFEDLKDIKVSPESIELCNKIAGGNDVVFNTLMNKVLNNELTRDDLRYAKWEVERIKANRKEDNKDHKDDKDNKDNKNDDEIDNYILNKYGNNHDQNNKTNKDNKTLELTNFIINHHNTRDFLRNLDKMIIERDDIELSDADNFKDIIIRTYKEFPIGNSITRHSRRSDALIIENITLHGHELTDRRVNLHGIEIKTDKNDLKQDKKMGEYSEAFDFCWLYVTEDLKDLALKLKPNNWGLLVFKTEIENDIEDDIEYENKSIEIIEIAEKKECPLSIEKTLRNVVNKTL